MRADTLFPSTHATWITVQLDAVDRGDNASADRALRELRDHVMRRYYEPLSAYLSATGYRDVDAPSALVAGYFVERFADAKSLAKWHESGLPLRRWLMNGLLLWVRAELRRRRTQAGRESALPAELLADTPTAEGIFEREWARAIVSDACEVVERELHDAGDARLWAIFARHVLDGRTYADIAAEQGVTAAAARNATRLVRERVDRALERLLLDEGVPPSDVSAELTRIQSLLARGPE
jgi:DNA-directed RNA polymerase specialized sigma24 family protein